MNKISKLLANHYSDRFDTYGPNSQGVDWGSDQNRADLRLFKMLDVIIDKKEPVSLLDVGCGFGALAELINHLHLQVDYTGIDIAQNMIEYASGMFDSSKKFICADFLEWNHLRTYDYIVCNGILTQKLSASHLEMHNYSKELLKKMFGIANKGIAFNCMTTYVNFQKDNLYYKNPSELLAWCMSELSPNIRLDAAYQLMYEYTVYVYGDIWND